MQLETDLLGDKLNELAPAPVDVVGNEAFAARSALERGKTIGLFLASFLLVGSAAMNVHFMQMPPKVVYIRIDGIGRAEAVRYDGLKYTPREGEIRRTLEDWIKYRYVRLRGSVSTTYKMNYYFVDAALASSLMAEDLRDKEIAELMSGQRPENDVLVNSIQFTRLSNQTAGAVLLEGQALIDLFKIIAATNVEPARREHWLLTVTFYLNPSQIAKQAEADPQYELNNPLGLVITEFHQTRAMN
jgi:type IV secretion system protein VirB5